MGNVKEKNDLFPYLQEDTEMSLLIRDYDWSKSPIGTPDQWPERLHSSISIALNAGFPIAIYWGEEFTLIYNDAWSSIPGNRHPWALGQSGAEVWPDIWESIQHQFINAYERGEIFRAPDTLLLMTRFGYTEETYFDYNLSPIRDAEGNIGGVFNTGIDTTYRVLNERRNIFLNRFAKIVTAPRSREESYEIIGLQLDTAVQDIPFCCIYMFEDDKQELKYCTGMDNIPTEKIRWPDQLHSNTNSVIIHDLHALLPYPVINYWPEPCEEALMVPLKNSYGGLSGFVVTGVSARKRLDTDYRHFLESVSGYIGTTISNGGVYEDEVQIKKQLVQREESLRRKIEEQLKLVSLVNNSIDLMSILELDGKNSYINPAGMKLLGFESLQQVLNTHITHLHDRADIEFVQSTVLPAIMSEGIWSGRMNVRHLQTGEVFPVHNNAIRIDDPDTNNTIAIGAVMRDMRPELAAQNALIESERNLRNVILHAPVAMCLLRGPEYVVEIANDVIIELWGKPAVSVLNKPIFEGLPDVREQGLEDLLSDVYTTGNTFRANEHPVQLVRKGVLEKLYLNFVYEPYRDSEGKVIGILAIAIDVTEQVNSRLKIEEMVEQRTNELAAANINLIRINDELTRSNVNLAEFAYAASHDLKEPARKIHIFTDRLSTLLHGRLTEEEKHYFARMQVTSERMTTLINDLLTYSEFNQQTSTNEKVDLTDLVQQVLIDLDLEIEQKQTVINVGDLGKVDGNKRQLQQAFHNLVGNALKYSKPDVRPVIKIESSRIEGKQLPLGLNSTESRTSYIHIRVTDNGLGFDPEDAERIFNVFTRLHYTPGYTGTGIGLSIVRKVVQNHNGHVWAESVINRGSTFHIALPVSSR